MTSKAFSIYFLLKGKKGLGNLCKLKKFRQDEKGSYLGNFFLRKSVILKKFL